jgi:hypothetical protein
MRTYPLTVGVDWEQARSGSDPWSPAPFVACPEGDFARVFPLLKRVFCRVGKAAAVQWGAPLRLQVLRAGFKEVTFGGRWVDDDMCEWLRRATIARCELLTAQMFALLAEKGSPIVHFFIEPDRTAEEWMRFVQLFPPHQYSYLPYDPLSPFVDMFHARDLPLPAAIYYDPRTQFQTLYTGELAYQDLGDWLAEIGSNETIPPPPPNRAQERRRGLPAAPVWVCVAVVSGAVACVRRRGALRLPAAFRARLAL